MRLNTDVKFACATPDQKIPQGTRRQAFAQFEVHLKAMNATAWYG